MSDRPDTLEATLQTAVQDLQWLSETDAPFTVVHWPQTETAVTVETVLQLTHHPAGTPIAVTDIDTFFAIATQPQAWHSPAEAVAVQRYQALVQTLKQHLSDLQVYRVGERAIDIYILGRLSNGDLAGVTTQAIET